MVRGSLVAIYNQEESVGFVSLNVLGIPTIEVV